VFDLPTTEIAEYWEGRAASADLAAVARARRAEYARYAAAPALPNRVVTTGAPYDALHAAPGVAPPAGAPGDARVLRGLGCSPGVAEGPVRVVTSPDDDLALAGHMLVAPRTDPGWAPLFPSAAAVVVERGSLLSHSAVLARELGLPAVVGIPGVVAALRDGERVRVDGLAGTVERLEAP
jgi:pyruvate,water dikinase